MSPRAEAQEPTQSLRGLLDVRAGLRCRAGERHTQSGSIRPEAARQRGPSWESRAQRWTPVPTEGRNGSSWEAGLWQRSVPQGVDPESLERQPRKGSRGRF